MSEMLARLQPSETLLAWTAHTLLYATIWLAVALVLARLMRRNAALRHALLLAGLCGALAAPAVAWWGSRGLPTWWSPSWPTQNISTPAKESPATIPDVEQRGPSLDELPLPSPPELVDVDSPPVPMPSETTGEHFVATDVNIGALTSPIAAEEALPPPVYDVSATILNENRLESSAEDIIPEVEGATAPEMPDTLPIENRATASDWFRAFLGMNMCAWLAGTAYQLVRLGLAWCGMVHMRRRLRPLTPERMTPLLHDLRAQLGGKPLPEIRVSVRALTPFSCGILRPLVVLPAWMENRVDRAMLRDVLIHELAHLERRDPAVVLSQRLAQALYWPHPLLYRLNRVLDEAREDLCDNHVLAQREATDYSRTLLELTPRLPVHSATVLATGLVTPRRKLEQRISALLDERRNVMTRLPASWACSMGLGFLALTLGLGGVRLWTASAQEISSDTAASESVSEDAVGDEISADDSTDEIFADTLASETTDVGEATSESNEDLFSDSSGESTADVASSASASADASSDSRADYIFGDVGVVEHDSNGKPVLADLEDANPAESSATRHVRQRTTWHGAIHRSDRRGRDLRIALDDYRGLKMGDVVKLYCVAGRGTPGFHGRFRVRVRHGNDFVSVAREKQPKHQPSELHGKDEVFLLLDSFRREASSTAATRQVPVAGRVGETVRIPPPSSQRPSLADFPGDTVVAGAVETRPDLPQPGIAVADSVPAESLPGEVVAPSAPAVPPVATPPAGLPELAAVPPQAVAQSVPRPRTPSTPTPSAAPQRPQDPSLYPPPAEIYDVIDPATSTPAIEPPQNVPSPTDPLVSPVVPNVANPLNVALPKAATPSMEALQWARALSEARLKLRTVEAEFGKAREAQKHQPGAIPELEMHRLATKREVYRLEYSLLKTLLKQSVISAQRNFEFTSAQFKTGELTVRDLHTAEDHMKMLETVLDKF